MSEDLTKYSKQLNYKETQRKLFKFTVSANGRKLPGMLARAKAIERSVQWEAARQELRSLDWSRSKIYALYYERVIK